MLPLQVDLKQHFGHLLQDLQNSSDGHRKHCSHILITDVVLQQLDLRLSFVAAHLQYVHELQQLSLQNLLLADKSSVSFRTGGTEHNLQSLVLSGDTDLHIKSVCSWPVFLSSENLHSNCPL